VNKSWLACTQSIDSVHLLTRIVYFLQVRWLFIDRRDWWTTWSWNIYNPRWRPPPGGRRTQYCHVYLFHILDDSKTLGMEYIKKFQPKCVLVMISKIMIRIKKKNLNKTLKTILKSDIYKISFQRLSQCI